MIHKNDDFILPDPWSPRAGGYGFVFLSLFIAVLIIYGNSLDCSWHFDDFKNIADNDNIHLQSLSWESIAKSLKGLPGEGMKRPLAYLSFAFNYYLGQKDVLGYHLVNLFIHYVTAILLFLFIHRTLNLPKVRDEFGRHSYSIALLATFFWALHPIQVYAVTYIVQRMASMAALFYLLALFLYLLARTAGKKNHRILYFAGVVLSACLALGTKETAATLPVALVLYELLLIREGKGKIPGAHLKAGIVLFSLLVFIGWLFVEPAKLFDGYRIRPFTLPERLLTEPRVIFFYISLLLYPLSSRFVLLHDIDISRNIFSPWTTAPAIVLLVILIMLAVVYARKRPIYSFCALFFFLNHAIESSFLSLEIVYEHRNYLPSLLFFVPIAALIVKGLDHFANRRTIVVTLSAAMVSFLIVEGVGVALQNDTLKDELTLWIDNTEKSPLLHRPHHNLAMEFMARGQFPAAYVELQMALKAKVLSATFEKYDAHFSLGQCYRIMGKDDLALQQFDESIRLVSYFPDVYQAQAEIMLTRGQYAVAETAIRRALYLNSRLPSLHVTYGEILLKKGDDAGALREVRKALVLNENSRRAYGILAEIFRRQKDVLRATHFGRLAQVTERPAR